MISLRLRTYFISYATLIPLLLTAAILVYYSYRFQEYSLEQLSVQGKALSKNIAFSVADDLVTENYAPLQGHIQAIVSNADIVAVQISDAVGQILAATDTRLLGTQMVLDPVGDCFPEDKGICERFDEKNSQFVVTTPVLVGGLEYGHTRVFLSTRDIIEHLHLVQRNGIMIGLGFWLIAVWIGYILSRYFTAPVQSFVEVAESISHGDFAVEIPQAGMIYEIDCFGNAFKVMAEAIASREQQMRISEKKYRHLFERALEGIFVADASGQLIDVNPAFLRIMSAASRGIMLEHNLFANIFESEESLQLFHKNIERNNFVKDYELSLIRSDSSAVSVALTCHVIRDEGGRITRFEGLIRDISAQKAAEKEIVRMRNYLNNIIESMPSMLITLDGESIVTQWNSAASRLTGIPSSKALGRKIYDVAPCFKKYSQHLLGINQQHQPLTLLREQMHPDSDHLYDMTFFPLIANGIEGIAIRLDDITELDRKEQQLRQAQKMESVGTLAGGLAHDFNNVLAAVLGNLSLLQHRLGTDQSLSTQEILDYLDRMETAGQRAVDMVRQLLSLSRHRTIDLIPVDLNMSIKHVLKLGENTFDKSVQLSTKLANEPAWVLADVTEMEQVVLNLSINALHAMTTMRGEAVWGGQLTIAVEKISVDSYFLKRHPEAEASMYWRLTVTDTGVGMETRTVAKIFDPFFTTKEQGKGTGLGLAMVYNIVKQQHGFIDVYSEPGHGSTFSVYLPVLVRSSEDVTPVIDVMALNRGEGQVLVVEDDAVVRGMAQEILQILGYTVLIAVNGREGVKLYSEHQAQIKAVLLDTVMPVMAGREAYLEMKKINPDVKVLLSSGFRQDERVQEILNLGVKSFLQKPYTISSLAEAMKKIIEG